MAKRAQRLNSRQENAAPRKKPKRRARSHRSAILLRWCVVGVLGFVAFLYYQPLASYVETRSTLNARQAEVRMLRTERTRLQVRLAHSATLTALTREARRNGLVRPGEQLFVVRGIAEWRRAQRATRLSEATIERDG
ncbi:MAG: septum formation initiator family protein [Gaiellaceae bacterium]